MYVTPRTFRRESVRLTFEPARRRVRHLRRPGPLRAAHGNRPSAQSDGHPLPSRWLHGLTVRVGTGVGRLLALARRELTAALVPAP